MIAPGNLQTVSKKVIITYRSGFERNGVLSSNVRKQLKIPENIDIVEVIYNGILFSDISIRKDGRLFFPKKQKEAFLSSFKLQDKQEIEIEVRYILKDQGQKSLIDVANKIQQGGSNMAQKGTMLVIDRSGSMKGDPLEQAKRGAIEEFVRPCAPNDYIGVISFSDTHSVDFPYQLKDNQGIAIENIINSLYADGYTALWDSMIAAIDQLAQANHGEEQFIVALTDGDDNRSKYTCEDVLKYAHDKGITPKIIIIGVGQLAEDECMENLARATGGRFIPSTPGKIREGYTQAGQAAGYRPPGPVYPGRAADQPVISTTRQSILEQPDVHYHPEKNHFHLEGEIDYLLRRKVQDRVSLIESFLERRFSLHFSSVSVPAYAVEDRKMFNKIWPPGVDDICVRLLEYLEEFSLESSIYMNKDKYRDDPIRQQDDYNKRNFCYYDPFIIFLSDIEFIPIIEEYIENIKNEYVNNNNHQIKPDVPRCPGIYYLPIDLYNAKSKNKHHARQRDIYIYNFEFGVTYYAIEAALYYSVSRLAIARSYHVDDTDQLITGWIDDKLPEEQTPNPAASVCDHSNGLMNGPLGTSILSSLTLLSFEEREMTEIVQNSWLTGLWNLPIYLISRYPDHAYDILNEFLDPILLKRLLDGDTINESDEVLRILKKIKTKLQ